MALPTVITRISVSSAGTQGNNNSYNPSISGTGRFVAYYSDASNLVAGDTNAERDIFVYDREAGTTSRISVSSTGVQADGSSRTPDISEDGRYVTFQSYASNLVAGGNNETDIFRHDRYTDTTVQVSLNSAGTGGNGVSDDPSISGAGRYVVFQSDATNLVAGDTIGVQDVFIHDQITGNTTRMSNGTGGAEADDTSEFSTITESGNFAAYGSRATNLVADDNNNQADVFVYSRASGTISRVSMASDGTEGNNWSNFASLSENGRYVAFVSKASNLVADDTNGYIDIFVHDRQTNETSRVSVATDGTEGENHSTHAGISADGRFVTFRSFATNLVDGDTNGEIDIFVHDRLTGSTRRVSIADDGTQSDAESHHTSLSADGRFITFRSQATNLVSGDTNGDWDIFTTANPLFSDDTANTMNGYSGEDRMDGLGGNDLIRGKGGNDTLFGRAGQDVLAGNAGDDNLYGGADNDSIFGGAGADRIYGDGGNDTIAGGSGDDVLRGGSGDDTVFAGSGNDTVSGNSGNDTLHGEDGNDRMFGGSGADAFFGGAGDDTINGNDGNDVLRGNAGDDDLSGNDGADILSGNDGADTLLGGIGNDKLYGGNGNDNLNGGAGNDRIDAGNDNDTLRGGDGADTLFGRSGTDTLSGNNGADTLFGGGGNDRLFGGNDDDTLKGGSNDDVLDGGAGSDSLTGNSGADTFVFKTIAGTNTVQDYEDGTDLIQYKGGSFADLTIVASGAHVDISAIAGGHMILLNENVADITAADFVFV